MNSKSATPALCARRRLGAAGFVLFSYDSLTGPKAPAPDYLATVARAVREAAASTPQLRNSAIPNSTSNAQLPTPKTPKIRNEV